MSFMTKDARRYRVVLSILLSIMVVSASGIVFLAIKYMDGYSETVKQAVYEANTSQAKIDNIRQLADKLKGESASVERVKQIVADSKNYEYQDVIIHDIDAMASRAGVSVINYDFSGKNSGASSSSAKPSTSSSGSLRSTTVSVTLANPVNYRDFLNFVHYVEQNNTKMQISSVSISSLGVGKGNGSINSNSLTLEVYIR